MRSSSRLLFAALLVLSGASERERANHHRRILRERCRRQRGLVLPGATVTILQEETGAIRNSVTNEVGAFNFAAVQPGPYTVRIELPGFGAYELTGAQLATNQQYNVGTVELSIAALEETVQVTAQRIVETISSDRSALITEETIDAITVRGRDVTSMLRILPGVGYQPDPDAIGEIVIGSWLPNVGGTRQGWSTVTIDGIPGNDIGLPEVSSHSMNPDAVGEVNVQLTNFTADTGRNGGAQINLVTKAGTERLLRHRLHLRPQRAVPQRGLLRQAGRGIPKPEYRYWTLGANAGGPIVQDKVFFFYSYEQWGGQDAAEPRPAHRSERWRERMGDFSQSFDQSGNLIPVIDPSTGMPFPGNVVPVRPDQPARAGAAELVPPIRTSTGSRTTTTSSRASSAHPRINNVTTGRRPPDDQRLDIRPLLALAAADQLLAGRLGEPGADVHLQRLRRRHQLHARHRRQHGERVQLRLAPLVGAQSLGRLLRHQPQPAHRFPHRLPRRRRPATTGATDPTRRARCHIPSRSGIRTTTCTGSFRR